MSRKQTLSNKIGARRRRETSIRDCTTEADMALALQNEGFTKSMFNKDTFRSSESLKSLSELSGLGIHDILKKVSKTNMKEMMFSSSELSTETETIKELHILYDVSGSMWYAREYGSYSSEAGCLYIPFHRKMGEVFRKLEVEGVKVMIYYFSCGHISMRPPITVEQFCSNERIPGGGTTLGPAWNQLSNHNGACLLITDGQFTDSVSSFNNLSHINGLTLGVPSWTTVSTNVVQQLRNKLGTIPLNHLPNIDSNYTVGQFANEINYGCNVVAIPDGYTRFGDLVFPECWLKPSVIGMLINNMLEHNREYVPYLFSNFKEIFTRILCTMKVDFEGCLRDEECRNLLHMVNIFMKVSLREINKIEKEHSSDTAELEPEPESDIDNEYNHFLDISEITKSIYDYGSNEKDTRYHKYISSGLTTNAEELNTLWDSCFSSDETDDIIDSHSSDKQTHTMIFKTPMPYEIIRQIRASAHALDKETMLCLILYFSKGNFEVREGIHQGYGTIPVWNNNWVNSIRLIPSHRIFPDSEGISFTFSVTVAYRILIWILSEMTGPNKNIFE